MNSRGKLFNYNFVNEIREMNQKEFGESAKHILVISIISFRT